MDTTPIKIESKKKKGAIELRVLKTIRGTKWRKGDFIYVSRNYAKKLIDSGVAVLPQDYNAKTKAEKK